MNPIDKVFPGQIVSISVPVQPIEYDKNKQKKMHDIEVKVVAVHKAEQKFDYDLNGTIFRNYAPPAEVKIVKDVPHPEPKPAPDAPLIHRIKGGQTVMLVLPSSPPAYDEKKQRTMETVKCVVKHINPKAGTIDFEREDMPKVVFHNLIVTAQNCRLEAEAHDEGAEKPLAKMNKAELIAKAKELGIAVTPKEDDPDDTEDTKVELLAAIEKKLK